ncbi:Hsp70 family protein [Georgenia sp. Z1344]|uniref:Hsp70 family protein n=1 Tax=Georgenia sp. Z1344 TaxID=3416706 RepID=UPI003CF8033A
MRLGVDLGTTRTIVAAADRGNYPVVSFVDQNGDWHDHVPSVSAYVDGSLVHGFAAEEAHRAGAPLLRSVKRVLARPDVSARSEVRVGRRTVPILDVLTSFLDALRTEIRTRSSVADPDLDDALGVAVGVPAHAHTAQRYLTLEAFRLAGFDVVAVLNEPSAAGFEYTHRQTRTISSRRTRVLVYDLGGGTFDASLVSVDGTSHDVLASAGLNDVGGDDVDVVLAQLAARAAGTDAAELEGRSTDAADDLLEQARVAKEAVHPQSRRLALDVEGRPVSVTVDDLYAAAAPLVERTVAAMAPLLGGDDESAPGLADVAGIYLVGGATSLPLVPRLLRRHYGRRVHRSPYPSASTAIGLAVAADPDSGYSLTDRLSRGFGVFREADHGRGTLLDPVLAPDDVLPSGGGVVARRTYRAAHDIGFFRFVEYSAIDDDGHPRGDIVPFAEVRVPYSAELFDVGDLAARPVRRIDDGPTVTEEYRVDAHGLVEVEITREDSGHRTAYRLGELTG